jgi:hypothetical protein
LCPQEDDRASRADDWASKADDWPPTSNEHVQWCKLTPQEIVRCIQPVPIHYTGPKSMDWSVSP